MQNIISVTIGVDPGIHGGIAIIDNRTESCKQLFDCPSIITEWVDLHQRIQDYNYRIQSVWVEKVSAFPGQGVTSMFTFGQEYGKAQMWLAFLSKRLFFVTPQQWMKLINWEQKKKGLDKYRRKVKRKKAVISFASRMWPNISFRQTDDGRADALCIALYGKRYFNNS